MGVNSLRSILHRHFEAPRLASLHALLGTADRPADDADAASDLALLAAFAGTMFLSAFLLFSVQPIFAKMVLPRLGGAPSVWAVAMCFFQAALLAGYAYAHFLNRYLPLKIAPLVHLAVVSFAVFALPFALPAFADQPPTGNTYLWLIAILTVGVGLPFFAVSANAPLLQAWFARSGHPHAADPYFLYGASNLGSLLALLSYPIVVEPMVGVSSQAATWAGGFIVLGFCLAGAALMMLAGARRAGLIDAHGNATAAESAAAAGAPCTSRYATRSATAPATIGRWVWLAFVPSALLVALTTHITTDIASAPFLWVVPLATFLATFIVVFRATPLISHERLAVALPLVVTTALLATVLPLFDGTLASALVGFAAFLVATLVAHRELYLARPDSADLTAFYLWMSVGGVLGGIFSAIVAPQVFSDVHEYPLLLAAALACHPGVREAVSSSVARRHALFAALVVLVPTNVVVWGEMAGLVPRGDVRLIAVVVALAAACLIVLNRQRPLAMSAAALALAVSLIQLFGAMLGDGSSHRSFFGVLRLVTTTDGAFRLMVHGNTVHGAERLVGIDGTPTTAPVPASYYYPGSPMHRGVVAARAASGRADGQLKVGIVGLGAGAMACHARDGETWRFFEIDPMIAAIARDPSKFRFMSTCRPNAEIVIGDARLTLTREQAQGFDYLLIDAFSSDAVPVHLLTREAIALYLGKLAPNGLIGLHISNRHMELASVVAATAALLPDTHVAEVRDTKGLSGYDGARNLMMFIAKREDVMARVRAWPDAYPADPADTTGWSDDYSDVLGAVVRREWSKFK